MISAETRRDSQVRIYDRAESAVFLKTNEEFGGLSNMAGGFPLSVNGLRIFTSEALYQACRFPHMPEIQRMIIAQASPMTAKMKSKPYRSESRPDWNRVRVKVMRWCLRVKLSQNWTRFSELLLATGSRPIVEFSRKDEFWGAKPVDERTLVGMNVLGRLLMELREEIRSGSHSPPMRVEPLQIPDFMLDGKPIQPVLGCGEGEGRVQRYDKRVRAPEPVAMEVQISMFERPPVASPPVLGVYVAEEDTRVHGLKPYPAYKDSGAPWLGQVPEHWEMKRNGRLYAQRNETGFPDLPILEVSLKTGVRIRSFEGTSRKQLMSDRDKYKRARRGDITYNMMRMWQGAVGIPPVDGLVSPAYVVARPFEGTEPRFFEFLFRTVGFMGEVNNYSRGIVSDRNRLYWDDFKQITSPYPPFEEQTAIVRFLGYADRRIQRYIRAKKKLIALLNEQKQAIIQRAVTRGLDPDVRLKPSGVEWLGEVPEHWEVKKLHQITDPNRSIMYGIVLPGPNVDEGVYIVKGGNCEPGKLRPELLSRTTFEIEAAYTRSRLRKNDLVIAIRGGVGAVELIPASLEGANLTQDAARISPGLGIDPRWLLYAVRGPVFQEHVRARVVGATVRGINIRDLKRVDIAVPPPGEQTAIVAYIEESLSGIYRADARASAEIDLLHEYRTRLIADVVTGKLDVREVAARLPVEAEEPELSNAGELLEEDEAESEDLDDLPEDAVA